LFVRNIALGLTITIGMALTAPVAMAQQKHHVSYDTPATQTTYTQQHIIDVGDIPGHQARLFEIQRTYGNDAPLINGSKLKEQWTRGMSDYIDNNGPALIYNVWILENGEKFFVRTSLVAQSSGDGKLTNMTSGVITGGTGSLARMRGIISRPLKFVPISRLPTDSNKLGILRPIVQKAFLFITSKRCVANHVAGLLKYCRGIKYRSWIVDLRHIFGVSTARTTTASP
jgi:hypothetical protein